MSSPFKQCPTWQETVHQMRKHRDDSIMAIEPRLPDILSQELPLNVTGVPKTILSGREIELTESSTESLLSSMAAGLVTSVEVTKAFLRRAGLAGLLVSIYHHIL
jgi:hypothetical protein